MDDEEVDDKESSYELKDSLYLDEIRVQAIECMESFFVDKKYWAGGSISKKKLLCEENIITVIQTSVLDALDVAYACLTEQRPQSYKTINPGWEVELCYETLKSCPRRMVPKCFAGGIMLVYLSLCQGIDYIEKLKEINTLLQGNYNSAI